MTNKSTKNILYGVAFAIFVLDIGISLYDGTSIIWQCIGLMWWFESLTVQKKINKLLNKLNKDE